MSHRSPPATSHWPVTTQPVQPFASSWHVSVTPFAPQRLLPWVQLVLHPVQLPPLQYAFGGHCCKGPHAGQLFWSMMHVSTPRPLQRVAPGVQFVPQVPQAPPEQKVLHVCDACQLVQPDASATQVCTVLPLQRLAPAVHAPLQLAQLPFWHALPGAHASARHLVQPDSTSHSQVSTPPPAVQRDAPRLHAWQLVHQPPVQTSP
jgi:hypothetical protein